MKIRMWHWRDVLCWFKLKFSKDGYSVKEFCGKCEKCNRLFGACGVIPCPMRFDKPVKTKPLTDEAPDGCLSTPVEGLQDDSPM